MAKALEFSFLVLFLLLSLLASSSQAYVVSSYQFDHKEYWKAALKQGDEKVTHLHFFFHDRVGGENATTVQVAKPPTEDKSPTRFGELVIADDPLTVGPDPNSEEVGRAQGMYGSTGMKEATLLMAFSFSFTKGEFSGSSLSMLSRNPISSTNRELAIVGGTGKFKLAKGIVKAKTVEVQRLSAIVEYNVDVFHYS